MLVYYFVPSVQELKNVQHQMPEIPKLYCTNRMIKKQIEFNLLAVYDISPVEFLFKNKNNKFLNQRFLLYT